MTRVEKRERIAAYKRYHFKCLCNELKIAVCRLPLNVAKVTLDLLTHCIMLFLLIGIMIFAFSFMLLAIQFFVTFLM